MSSPSDVNLVTFSPGALEEGPTDKQSLDIKRRPSVRRRAHKRHVSGLSVGANELDEFIALSEPIATETDSPGYLKRTKSMNNQDLSRMMQPMLRQQVEDEDDISKLSQRLASRRVSISSNNADDEIANVVAAASSDSVSSDYLNTMLSIPSPRGSGGTFFHHSGAEAMDLMPEYGEPFRHPESVRSPHRPHHGHRRAKTFGEFSTFSNVENQDKRNIERNAFAHPQKTTFGTGTRTGTSDSTDSGVSSEAPSSGRGMDDGLDMMSVHISTTETDIDGWTLEEDLQLKQMIEKLGQNHEDIAATHPGWTAEKCRARWEELSRGNYKKGTWIPQEDARLLNLYCGHTKRSWSDIAALIPGRSAKQCRERWCYNLDPNINKDPWKKEEDMILMNAQKSMGNKWAQIAAMLPGRTENAVKTRFKSIMRAKKREWHPQEDQIILSLHEQLGSRWEDIAKQLPNRSKNAVKTRYRLLSKGLASEQPEEGSPNQILRQPEFPKIPHSIGGPTAHHYPHPHMQHHSQQQSLSPSQQQQQQFQPKLKQEIHQQQKQEQPRQAMTGKKPAAKTQTKRPASTPTNKRGGKASTAPKTKLQGKGDKTSKEPVYNSQAHGTEQGKSSYANMIGSAAAVSVAQQFVKNEAPEMYMGGLQHDFHQQQQSEHMHPADYPRRYSTDYSENASSSMMNDPYVRMSGPSVHPSKRSTHAAQRSELGAYAHSPMYEYEAYSPMMEGGGEADPIQGEKAPRRHSMNNFFPFGADNYLNAFTAMESRGRPALSSPGPLSAADQMQQVEDSFLNEAAPSMDEDFAEFLDMWQKP